VAQQTCCAQHQHAQRETTVVVAGSGYGGLSAVRALSGEAHSVRVIVIDRNPYHLLQYQLHEAGAGKIDAATLAVPLRALLPRNVEFRQAAIRRLDFNSQVVRTSGGDVRYDRLIIALGGQPATFGIPGLEQNALTLKSLKDARRLNGHIEWTLAYAAQTEDVRARTIGLTFAIGGAGITGVELAAELAEKFGDRAQDYDLDPREIRVVLLEAAPTILPGFDAETIAEATKALKRLGVALRTNAIITRVEEGQVVLKGGNLLETGTFIWTGGVRANQLVLDSDLTIEGRGAAVVDAFLRPVEHPDVTIIGDCALVRDPRHGGIALPCAQLAVQQGQYAARDIVAEIRGDVRQPYVPHMHGLLISLGSQRGVGTIGPLFVRRLVARLGKVGAETRYMWKIGGLRLLVSRWLRLRAEWVGLARRCRQGRRHFAHTRSGILRRSTS